MQDALPSLSDHICAVQPLGHRARDVQVSRFVVQQHIAIARET